MTARKMMTKSGLAALLGGAAIALAATPAAAHTPYVVPFTFSPERDYVGVEGGMAEEAFFIPDFGIRGSGDWIVIGPDGAAKPVTPTALKSVTVVDAPLPTEGTYRIGTGERPGRAGKSAKVDGVWRNVRPAPPAGAAPAAGPARPMERRDDDDAARGPGPINAADIPAGAEVIDFQSFLVAETFVTRGAPTPVKPLGKGFEIEPITHPNEIFLDDGFTFRAVVDGQPIAGLPISIYRGGEAYAEGRTVIEVKTGADGKATIKFDKPGVYLLNTRYPALPVPGAAPALKNWGYSLTFEVTQ
jgi:hypothetical protein